MPLTPSNEQTEPLTESQILSLRLREVANLVEERNYYQALRRLQQIQVRFHLSSNKELGNLAQEKKEKKLTQSVAAAADNTVIGTGYSEANLKQWVEEQLKEEANFSNSWPPRVVSLSERAVNFAAFTANPPRAFLMIELIRKGIRFEKPLAEAAWLDLYLKALDQAEKNLRQLFVSFLRGFDLNQERLPGALLLFLEREVRLLQENLNSLSAEEKKEIQHCAREVARLELALRAYRAINPPPEIAYADAETIARWQQENQQKIKKLAAETALNKDELEDGLNNPLKFLTNSESR